MSVDASIYNNVRPFQMADPLDQASKAMSLRAANRQFTLEDDISGALAGAGGDYTKASDTLARAGRGTAALQLAGRADAQAKAKMEQQLKLYEESGNDAIALDAIYRQALQEAGGDQQAALAKAQAAYTPIRDKWKALGKPLGENFNPQENAAFIGQAKHAVEYLKSLAPEFQGAHPAVNPATGKPDLYQPPKGPGTGRFLGVQPSAAPAGPTELSRLQAERDALPEGDPRRAEYDRVLSNYKAGHGTDVTVNTGPMAPSKTAATKVDEDLLSMTKSVMALDQISAQFRPEYQRFADRAQFAALGVKDSTVGLNNKERKDLTDYSAYRRNAVGQINQYIHDMTGAAMGVQEAQRLMKAVPNPGSGIFDGDSPTEFKAKLDDVVSKTKMAVARLSYIKRNGMSLEDGNGNAVIPLERMPALINERGKAIEAQLKAAQPGVSDAALQRAVRRQLSVEFGLSND